MGVEVSASQLTIKDELSKIGSFEVMINFHPEVRSNITIKIDKIKSN
jgi:ribosomal protein L9